MAKYHRHRMLPNEPVFGNFFLLWVGDRFVCQDYLLRIWYYIKTTVSFFLYLPVLFIVPVRDSAKFKNKLMGDKVYFNLRKNKQISHTGDILYLRSFLFLFQRIMNNVIHYIHLNILERLSVVCIRGRWTP